MNLKEVGLGGKDWITLAQVGAGGMHLRNVVMNLWVP
jgi:hypothetical protein